MAPICQRGGLDAGTTTTTASTTTQTTAERPECPYGWETYTGDGSSVKCFKYCGDREYAAYCGILYATYAEQNCQDQGGHLASIHSMEEQNFLMHTFNPSARVWIGAVDTDHNGVWEWTDGSSFDFSYWRSGQPDGQYYTVMDDISSGGWRDLDYNERYQYFCQLTL